MRYVVCHDAREFNAWKRMARDDYSIETANAVMIATSIDPEQTLALRGRIITDSDVIERLGKYDDGAYWHDVEDLLAVAGRGVVDTGDPRRPSSS